MAIVKKNTYVSGSNNDITNVALNVDLQRLGQDLVYVTYSAPNFVIKAGSLIECNGSLYAVESSDINITAADGVLIFDSATMAFSISSSAYSYDATRAGEYITGSTTKRVTKYNTYATGSYFVRAINSNYPWYIPLGASKSGTDTQNNYFDFFAPFIPNTGDSVLCSGGWGSYIIATKMDRTSSTVITITGWNGSASTTQTLTDASGTNLTASLAI